MCASSLRSQRGVRKSHYDRLNDSLCERMKGRNHGIVQVSIFDQLIVPAKIISMIEEDTTASIEGYQGSIKIVEDVQCFLIHAKDLSDGDENELDEASERGAVDSEP